jgi:hypothetical protein
VVPSGLVVTETTRPRTSTFLSFSMIGDKFVLRYENFAAVFGFSV